MLRKDVELDAQRKRAYRAILYVAMLDLRRHTPTSPYTRATWWNPLFWRRVLARLRYAMLMADWLHNLALYSATDFESFNESSFWKQYDQFPPRVVSHALDDYRAMFDRELTGEGWIRVNEKSG